MTLRYGLNIYSAIIIYERGLRDLFLAYYSRINEEWILGTKVFILVDDGHNMRNLEFDPTPFKDILAQHGIESVVSEDGEDLIDELFQPYLLQYVILI
jgi:hypothetical protein